MPRLPQTRVETPDLEWRKSPYVVASGFCMGTADVVPGVSGGTMAVAMGIYEQLLRAIVSIDAEAVGSLLRFRIAAVLARVHWRFLASIGLGIGLGIGVMVKVVGLPHLIETEPTHVYAAFFGLVLASAVVLARTVPRWDGRAWLSLVVGAVLGHLLVRLVPVSTPDAAWFVFVSGAVAISAMLLPGISGSFILLILGKYAYVLDALGRLDFTVLVPFILGIVVGITGFSRLIGWALARWHDPMIAGLAGLLLGSLWRIWPYQELTTIIVREKPRVVGAEPFLPTSLDVGVVALVVAGVVAPLVLERYARLRAERAS